MPRFVPAQSTALDLPAEVRAEIDAAWERAEDWAADDLELHFEVSVSGRVRGELRDLFGGQLVSRLSATEALAVACGDVEPAVAA